LNKLYLKQIYRINRKPSKIRFMVKQ